MKRGAYIAVAGCLVIIAAAFAGCGGASGSDVNVSSGSADIPIVVDSASAMNVGDLMFVQMDQSYLVLDFAGVDEDAEFALIAGTGEYGSSVSLLVSDDLLLDVDKSAFPSPEPTGNSRAAGDAYGPEEILSAWLRASERDIAETQPGPSFSVEKSLGAAKAVGLGDIETFRVLASLYSTSDYVSVSARAMCVTDRIAVFVDRRVASDDLSGADISEICDRFDEMAEWEFDVLGGASDVNGDGTVSVLITPQVNSLGSAVGGIVGGYFFGADLYGRSDSNPTSDEREIIYALAPDPDGTHGASISIEYYLDELIPAVLPHELQHAINFNQHVFVNSGQPEEPWLNEGLSHLVEDLVGYGNSNPSRYALFLASPSTTPLVSDSSPGLAQRGADYLFMRYLYERADDGDAFLGRLVGSSLTGTANIENAFAGSDDSFDEFPEMIARWTAAVALSSMGLGNGSEYAYDERVTDGTTGNWRGAVFNGSAEDGRGTSLSGVHMNRYSGYDNVTLSPSSARYLSIEDVPNEIGVQAGGDANFAVLIRTR